MPRANNQIKHPGRHAVNRIRKFYPNVTSVVDATKSVRIVVKREDRHGTPKAPNDCAMARACQRQLPVDGALVWPSVAYLVKGRKAIRYNLPESVSREVISFDRHRDFRPGEYQFSPIAESQRFGVKYVPVSDRDHRSKEDGSRPRPKVLHRTVGVRV